MKFTTFVIIPSEIEETEYKKYVKKVLAPYDRNLEVSPYKKILSDKENTTVLASKYGCRIDELHEHLNLEETDWMENGEIWCMSTFNKAATWDYYYIEEYTLMTELQYVASAFIDTEGIWHDISEFEYSMLLNKYNGNKVIIHPDNKKAHNLHEIEFKKYYDKHKLNMVAVLYTHS